LKHTLKKSATRFAVSGLCSAILIYPLITNGLNWYLIPVFVMYVITSTQKNEIDMEMEFLKGKTAAYSEIQSLIEERKGE
jgi:hypothetical protein